jgi:hypothetical protein
MSYPLVQYLFAASLALNFSALPSFAQLTFDLEALETAAKSVTATGLIEGCDPMIDPGCHIPGLGGTGPNGCTDCMPSSLLDALTRDSRLYLPNVLDVDGTKIELLEENIGSGTYFSLPSQ